LELAPSDYLVGTGGWAYFNVPEKQVLRTYSQLFNFVEVNYTFYEYPEVRRVEGWRKAVPSNFVFSVRCHQDLTHKIGLRPTDEAHNVLNQMLGYCEILNAPFLVLETPVGYAMSKQEVKKARDLISSSNLEGVRMVWEIRAPLTSFVSDLMRDFNIVHCVDLSRAEPCFDSDVVYSRLFGKGLHNIYQFTDEELIEIDEKANKHRGKIMALSYHGLRMNTDAARFVHYKKTREFMQATPFTGVESIRAVLSEDAKFPSSREDLAAHQGWKVVDVTANRRVRLYELLSKISDKTYGSVDEAVAALETVI
jgi:uncharacterized protein YecE (DUF72 family)